MNLAGPQLREHFYEARGRAPRGPLKPLGLLGPQAGNSAPWSEDRSFEVQLSVEACRGEGALALGVAVSLSAFLSVRSEDLVTLLTPSFSTQDAKMATYQVVELRILTNWGHPEYTCIYRFRVHGDPTH